MWLSLYTARSTWIGYLAHGLPPIPGPGEGSLDCLVFEAPSSAAAAAGPAPASRPRPVGSSSCFFFPKSEPKKPLSLSFPSRSLLSLAVSVFSFFLSLPHIVLSRPFFSFSLLDFVERTEGAGLTEGLIGRDCGWCAEEAGCG